MLLGLIEPTQTVCHFFGCARSANSCIGVSCVDCGEKFVVVWLALLFAFCGLFGMRLPFGEVVLNLVDYRVRCEGNSSSLDVVYFVVYRILLS